jgi:hypothetical protein
MSDPAKTLAFVTIPKEQWIPFLAEFTRRNRGAHARLEILNADSGYLVETEDRPFDGAAADVKDGEHTLWISFGSTPDDSLSHAVQRTAALYASRASKGSGEVLAAEAGDGSRTLLHLSRPEDFALPQAE